MMMSNDAAVYGAFMMEGVRDFCHTLNGVRGYTDLLEKWGGGCIELIIELTSYTEYIDECVQTYIEEECGFPGVFEYEVVSPFGIWFAKYVMEHGYAPLRSEAMAEIVGLVHAFFEQ